MILLMSAGSLVISPFLFLILVTCVFSFFSFVILADILSIYQRTSFWFHLKFIRIYFITWVWVYLDNFVLWTWEECVLWYWLGWGFYKFQLHPLDWWWCSISLLIFCLLLSLITEEVCWSAQVQYNWGFVYFPFQFHQFLLHTVESYVVRYVHI